MHVQEMIATHPHVRGNINEALIRCIEACYDCAQTCTVCADACLGEDMVKDLIQCIRLNLDCADVCAATGQIASRRTGTNELTIKSMIETCADACRLCSDECEKHLQAVAPSENRAHLPRANRPPERSRRRCNERSAGAADRSGRVATAS